MILDDMGSTGSQDPRERLVPGEPEVGGGGGLVVVSVTLGVLQAQEL